jgi:hypothetical protein
MFLFCWPAAYIAGQKGRDMVPWFCAGLLFGPMATLMVGLSPALPKNTAPANDADSWLAANPDSQFPARLAQTHEAARQALRKRFCPDCGAPLAEDDLFCGGCGRKAN